MKLTHYTGSWSEDDRVLVEQAVQQVEEDGEGHGGGAAFGALWILCVYPSLQRPLYTASRYRLDVVLTGRSAAELAGRITRIRSVDTVLDGRA